MIKLKTTSAKRPRPSKPKIGEPIDLFSLSYARARNKNAAHSLVLDSLEKSGISRADLAKALGKEPSQVSRWLGSAGNMTIDTLSDLLFATSGCLVSFEPVDPFVGGKSNHQAVADYTSVKIRVAGKPEVTNPTFILSAPREGRRYERVG